MTNINLASFEEDANGKKGMPYKQGLIWISVIFILVLGSYAGIVLYQKYVTQKISSVQNSYSEEFKRLADGEAKNVVDMQNRIKKSEKVFSEKNSSTDSLAMLEKTVIPAAYVSNFSYDQGKNSISLDMITDNFASLAKQVLNFKQNNYFSEVNLGSTSLDDKGKVKFSLELKIN